VRSELFAEIDRLFAAGRSAALLLSEQIQLMAVANGFSQEAQEDDAKVTITADQQLRKNLPDVLDLLASWWRDLLVTALNQPEMRLNRDCADMFDRHCGSASQEQLSKALQQIMLTKRLIERNANIDLALNNMCMLILPPR